MIITGGGKRTASHDADAQGCYEPRGKDMRFVLLQVLLPALDKEKTRRGKRPCFVFMHFSHQPASRLGEASFFLLPCVAPRSSILSVLVCWVRGQALQYVRSCATQQRRTTIVYSV